MSSITSQRVLSDNGSAPFNFVTDRKSLGVGDDPWTVRKSGSSERLIEREVAMTAYRHGGTRRRPLHRVPVKRR
jgi:hypothetical protein